MFPKGFVWGCATAAYQVEGSPLADGAGPSIWHRFLHSPHAGHNGDNGDVACDHYRRFMDDVALMKRLGMQAYRFSLAWSRILPEGTGRINQAGLDFYSRLIDELLDNGIEPFVTLYHWDLPAALDDMGGWLNRQSADWFAEYARIAFRAFDGRVKKWMTLNEPWVVADGGYLHGALAPGHRNLFEAPIVARNLMRAHGAAVRTYRDVGAHQIGLVVNIEPKYPASDRTGDIAATRRAAAYMNEQYLDPALFGTNPPELKDVFGEAWIDWSAEDHRDVAQPIDFIGVNYYTRSVTRDDSAMLPVRAASVRQPGALYTETGWEVCPDAFTDTLRWVKDRYGAIPIYITENGAAFADPPAAANGEVRDPLRVAYLRDHLRAVHTAIQDGIDVRGYMVWSLLDNLEWSLGYSKRFGIVHVDFANQQRTPKDSALFYSSVINSNGGVLREPVGDTARLDTEGASGTEWGGTWVTFKSGA